MRRVKFYSKNDLAVGYYLKNVTDLILEFSEKHFDDINEILELYNCTKYIDNKLFLKEWSENYIMSLKEKSREIMGYIARKFNQIDGTNFIDIVSQIDNMYKEDFLELFSKFKLTKIIDDSKIKSLFELRYLSIYQVCKYKY